MCLVRDVSIYPYEAYWQPLTEEGNHPVYAPQVKYRISADNHHSKNGAVVCVTRGEVMNR